MMSYWIKSGFLAFNLCLLLYIQGGAAAKIVKRPNDVIGPSCGSEIRMTCVATSKIVRRINPQANPPEIKWWHRNQTSSVTSSKQVKHDERVEIEIEEYYTVRSTLIIRDARVADEGVYQCRASNNPHRHKPGLQYWKIEEAPVADIRCPPPPQESTSTNPPISTTTTTTTSSSTTSISHQNIPTQPTKVSDVTREVKRNVSEVGSDVKEVKVISPSYPQALTTRSLPSHNNKRVRNTKRTNRTPRRSSATTPDGTGAGLTAFRPSIVYVIAHILCALLTAFTLT